MIPIAGDDNDPTKKTTTKGGKNKPTRKATRRQQSTDKEVITQGGGDYKGKNKKGENRTVLLSASAEMLLGPSTYCLFDLIEMFDLLHTFTTKNR